MSDEMLLDPSRAEASMWTGALKTPDLQNIIINKDPEALVWARLLFLYFQSGAETVDLNTF
jgi:hypothetical protein